MWVCTTVKAGYILNLFLNIQGIGAGKEEIMNEKEKHYSKIYLFVVVLLIALGGYLCGRSQKVGQSLNLLEQNSERQEKLIAELLQNSKITEEDYNNQKLQLQALLMEIQSLQTDLLMTEESSKRLEALLAKTEESLIALEKKYEREIKRHKQQKIVIGGIAGAVAIGVVALSRQ